MPIVQFDSLSQAGRTQVGPVKLAGSRAEDQQG